MKRMSQKNSIKVSLITLIALCIMAAAFQSGFSAAVYADSADERAAQILSGMETKEKIAQMMVVAMPEKNAASVQKKYQFGGYILFGRDFKNNSKNGMKKLLRSCQTASEIPMLMGTDEEGGTVVRASLYKKYRKTRFRSPQNVYKSGGYKAVKKDISAKDKFLKSLGLNCNFGIVADVPYSSRNFIFRRAFSKKDGKTTKYVKLAVTEMGKDNVISVLKHFPGYGKNGDTHGKIIRDKRSKKILVKRDLKPFRAGISEGADMIMMSHTIVNAFDKTRPASLSPAVIGYLRKDMGYDGVIITDGLAMKGITDFVGGDQGKAAVQAVKAGNDMLCVTGNYKKCYDALVEAAKNGKISEEQIDESVLRILKMKIKRGLI